MRVNGCRRAGDGLPRRARTAQAAAEQPGPGTRERATAPPGAAGSRALSLWTPIHAGASLVLTAAAAYVAINRDAAAIPALGSGAAPADAGGTVPVILAATVALAASSYPVLHRMLPMQRRRTADLITTVRMVLVSLAALWEAAGAAAVFDGGHMLLGPAFLVAAAALTDYVDGVIARRSGPSEGGARWDMETDAYVMFALSLMVVLSRGLPVWVLFIGALRYLFVFPFALLPQLPAGAGGPVFKLLAKTACAVAVVTLLTGLVPAMAGGAAAVLNAAALGALLLSFGWETAIRLRIRHSWVRHR